MGSSNSKPPNNPMEREIYFAKLKEKRLRSEQKRRERIEKSEKRNLVKKNILQKFHIIKSNSSEQNADKSIVQQAIKDSDINNLQNTPNNHYTINSEDYDLIVAAKLKTQISEEFTNFLINQMLLSIQFFANFEKDKNEAIEKILKKENHKNKKLEKHTIILTNVLDEAVKKTIQYQPRHGANKLIQTPIQIPTMYIVFENIEISKPDDASYDVISPTCSVDIDTEVVGEMKKFKGYLRLKLRDIQHNGIENNDGHSTRMLSSLSDDSDIGGNNFSYNSHSTADYDVFDDDKNVSYNYNQENDYGYITSLNIHQPLAELKKSRDIKVDNSKLLPEKCITIIRYHLYENEISQTDSSSDDDSVASDGAIEDSNENHNHGRINKNVIEEKYLNSKSFLSYYATLLEEHLAKELNFSNVDLENATWKGASIFTKKYETIPAIHLRAWPDCAFEWKLRSRPIRLNPLTGKKFQWPTQDMIKKIESFGCHVIPYGYAPKTKKNLYRDLEWKITFPKGERHLEQNLTNTQVKVLILVKVLLKTFLDPELNDTYQFSIDFIKMHMFWECEENFLAWPEEYLGEILIRFLQSFLDKTRSKNLPDYFIRGRNLFECVPDSILILVHNVITDIIQNPIIHIIAAYRNLVKLQDHFPQLNYREIFRVISIENPITILNTLPDSCVKANRILEQMYQKDVSENRKSDVHENDNDLVHRGLIGYSQAKEKEIKNAIDNKRTMKKRIRTINVKKKSNVPSQFRKESVDSIDISFYAGSNLDNIERPNDKKNLRQVLDDIRRTLIVEMFIKHFILLAENFYTYQSMDQAQIYLKQSTRMTYLLKVYQYETAANEYMESIQYVIDKIRSESEFPPALPKRTSLEPVQSFRKTIEIERKASGKKENEAPSAIEPRSFSVEADVHHGKEIKSILKQSSVLNTEKIITISSMQNHENGQTDQEPVHSTMTVIEDERSISFLHKNKLTYDNDSRSLSIEDDVSLDISKKVTNILSTVGSKENKSNSDGTSQKASKNEICLTSENSVADDDADENLDDTKL